MNKILLACCLGDGSLKPDGTFRVLHCEKQLEYLQYKAKFFDAIVKPIENNGFKSYYFQKGVNNPRFKGQEVRKSLYEILGHKYFSKKIVNEMDLFSFAILYLDDGSLCAKRRNGKIHAYDLVFSIYGLKSECEFLIDKLKEWDLNFTLKYNKNKYSIRCGTQTARKFLSLIRPLVPDFECFKDNKMLDISK